MATEKDAERVEATGASVSDRAKRWIVCGDTGLSSKAIWRTMMGVGMPEPTLGYFDSYPFDPGDFGRCYRLLAEIPEWRERLPEMAAVHPVWAGLVERWDEIEALYLEELAGRSGMAPKCYALMREIRASHERRPEPKPRST